MEFTYDIFPAERLIVARYAGRFTFAELVATAERMWADPRYSRSFDGAVDLTDSAVGVGMDDFRALVNFLRDHKNTSQGRWAAVATSPLATACSLIYSRALASRHTFEVFATFPGASSFLGFDLGPGPLLPGTPAPRRR